MLPWTEVSCRNNNLKTEVETLRDLNRDPYWRIRLLGKDMESESEDENCEDELERDGLFLCEECGNQFGVEKYFKDYIKKHESEKKIGSSTDEIEVIYWRKILK